MQYSYPSAAIGGLDGFVGELNDEWKSSVTEATSHIYRRRHLIGYRRTESGSLCRPGWVALNGNQ